MPIIIITPGHYLLQNITITIRRKESFKALWLYVYCTVLVELVKEKSLGVLYWKATIRRLLSVWQGHSSPPRRPHYVRAAFRVWLKSLLYSYRIQYFVRLEIVSDKFTKRPHYTNPSSPPFSPHCCWFYSFGQIRRTYTLLVYILGL